MLFHREVVFNGHHPLDIAILGRVVFIAFKSVQHVLLIHLICWMDVSRTKFVSSLTE